MSVTYITGCDSKYFLMTGILLEAFRKYCSGRALYVCDFGMEQFQRDILLKSGVLLEKPPILEDNQHPWIYKSSLATYLNHASITQDTVVWIDSDCFPVGPFANEVEKMICKWGNLDNIVALCRGKVGKTWQLASPPGNILHFNMQPHYPYFNSGMWILRSKTLLEHWADEIKSVPKNGMYEQDTFNYLLNKLSLDVHTLENERWNVTHDSLERVAITRSGEMLLNNQQVLLIHITGNYTTLKVSAGPITGFIRALKKSELKHFQLQLFKEWVASIHS